MKFRTQVHEVLVFQSLLAVKNDRFVFGTISVLRVRTMRTSVFNFSASLLFGSWKVSSERF